jgi:hypothetical protein
MAASAEASRPLAAISLPLRYGSTIPEYPDEAIVKPLEPGDYWALLVLSCGSDRNRKWNEYYEYFFGAGFTLDNHLMLVQPAQGRQM